jgi:tetratricopeptide repeat protein 21B
MEKSFQQINTYVVNDSEFIPAYLFLANYFMVTNQPAKARNSLKRIAKMKFSEEYSVEMEKSLLLLAHCYIAIGKHDLAGELCRRVLTINGSNVKSYEMLGNILEKEQSFKEAADSYEVAWKNSFYENAAIGFKLAFNYLKGKKYVEAIDVAHRILAAFPDYPKVRKEILEKARQALRP